MSRRILYIHFADPAAYPPIQHSSQILAERGWEVLMLGTDAFGVHSLAMSSVPGIRIKNLALAKSGGRLSVQYILFSCWCIYWACIWRPLWIYASDPLPLPVVWFMKWFIGRRVVYHEHDAPIVGAKLSSFMKAVFACRTKIARQAELCIIPQRDRLALFTKSTGRTGPTLCIWNCPRLNEIALRAEQRESKDPLIIYYHGSINRERLPESVVIAACRFKGAVRIQVAGYEAPGSVGYVKALMKCATATGAGNIIDYLGTIPLRADLLRSAAMADVGLSIMPESSNDINLKYMLGASNKAFDYMACGLPLLVTDLPDWKETFVTPGYGRACNPKDVDSIEAELGWYLNHRVERHNMGLKALKRIQESWNYDVLFAEVVAFLEQ
jgi:glycosyltransferase involved in cell wall biosynthesis